MGRRLPQGGCRHLTIAYRQTPEWCHARFDHLGDYPLSDHTAEPVTVIGLGDMGRALAETLLNHDYKVIVWNRSVDKAAPLVEQGAAHAMSMAEALKAAPLTMVCVSDHAATMQLLALDDVRAAAAGRTLVQLSTITSAESLELADLLGQIGTHYLDAQVLSFPDDVREGRAKIVCSGPRDAFERYAETLTAVAGSVLHVGDQYGAAATFDKAHLSFAMGNYLAFLHGAAMCVKSGVDLRAWCDFNVRHMESGAVARELAILADQITERSYDEGLEATMEVWRGGMAKTVAECRVLDVDEAHMASLMKLADKSIGAGFGDKELGAMIEQLIATKD